MAIAALLIGGAIAYFTVFRRGPAPANVPTQTEQAVKPPPARGLAEPGENIPLPPLDESDALVRQLVGRLSSHPTVAAWLTTENLVRNFTVVVFNIAGGQTPAVNLRKVRPVGKFLTRESAGRTFIDPRSYQRYDPYAAAVEAIDARGAARSVRDAEAANQGRVPGSRPWRRRRGSRARDRASATNAGRRGRADRVGQRDVHLTSIPRSSPCRARSGSCCGWARAIKG